MLMKAAHRYRSDSASPMSAADREAVLVKTLNRWAWGGRDWLRLSAPVTNGALTARGAGLWSRGTKQGIY